MMYSFKVSEIRPMGELTKVSIEVKKLEEKRYRYLTLISFLTDRKVRVYKEEHLDADLERGQAIIKALCKM